MEYIHLVGVEQVQSAANTMSRAADEMKGAAGAIEYSLEAHRRFMDDWLQRFTDVLDRKFPDRPQTWTGPG